MLVEESLKNDGRRRAIVVPMMCGSKSHGLGTAIGLTNTKHRKRGGCLDTFCKAIGFGRDGILPTGE